MEGVLGVVVVGGDVDGGCLDASDVDCPAFISFPAGSSVKLSFWRLLGKHMTDIQNAFAAKAYYSGRLYSSYRMTFRFILSPSRRIRGFA